MKAEQAMKSSSHQNEGNDLIDVIDFIQPASEASGLAEGQRARFAREAATRFYPPPTPSGAVGHNPKSGSGQFLGRTSLEMRFTRVGVKSKIGHTTRVDAYVCLTLHAGRVKRVKCVKRAILGKIRLLHFSLLAPLNSPYPKDVLAKKYTKSNWIWVLFVKKMISNAFRRKTARFAFFQSVKNRP